MKIFKHLKWWFKILFFKILNSKKNLIINLVLYSSLKKPIYLIDENNVHLYWISKFEEIRLNVKINIICKTWKSNQIYFINYFWILFKIIKKSPQ